MTITILSDNIITPESPLQECEHGLSFYIEFQGNKILCDFGASDLYARVARAMNIDLTQIDFAFLSHDHYDHTGGLLHFLENFPANVYISDKAFTTKLFSGKNTHHYIGSDPAIPQRFPERLISVKQSCWISDDIAIVKTVHKDSDTPWGNKFLLKEQDGRLVPDDFAHEQSLVFRTTEGLIIISSCSHCGMLNIIASAVAFTGETKVKTFVGGLHLVENAPPEEAKSVVAAAKKHYPDMTIITGHCTCDRAKQEFDLTFSVGARF